MYLNRLQCVLGQQLSTLHVMQDPVMRVTLTININIGHYAFQHQVIRIFFQEFSTVRTFHD